MSASFDWLASNSPLLPPKAIRRLAYSHPTPIPASARPRAARSGWREGEERAAEAAVRDPLLRAGDPPAVGGRLRTGAKRAGVGACARLGEGEGADHLAAGQRRHEADLLLGRPEGED